jgi:hypothetical protein
MRLFFLTQNGYFRQILKSFETAVSQLLHGISGCRKLSKLSSIAYANF